jgi:hypothetical protein
MNKLLDQTHFSARDVLEIMGVQNPGMLDLLRMTAALCAHTPEADTYSEWINSEGRKVREPLERPHSLRAVLAAAGDMGAASLVREIRDVEGERLALGFAPRLDPAPLPAPAPSASPAPLPRAVSDTPAPSPAARAVPVSAQHREAVLDALRSLGVDPLAVSTPLGKKGDKARARAVLGGKMTDSQFRKAWEYLHREKEILDA